MLIYIIMVLPRNMRKMRSKNTKTGGGTKKAGLPILLSSSIRSRRMLSKGLLSFLPNLTPAKIKSVEVYSEKDKQHIIAVVFSRNIDIYGVQTSDWKITGLDNNRIKQAPNQDMWDKIAIADAKLDSVTIKTPYPNEKANISADFTENPLEIKSIKKNIKSKDIVLIELKNDNYQIQRGQEIYISYSGNKIKASNVYLNATDRLVPKTNLLKINTVDSVDILSAALRIRCNKNIVNKANRQLTVTLDFIKPVNEIKKENIKLVRDGVDVTNDVDDYLIKNNDKYFDITNNNDKNVTIKLEIKDNIEFGNEKFNIRISEYKSLSNGIVGVDTDSVDITFDSKKPAFKIGNANANDNQIGMTWDVTADNWDQNNTEPLENGNIPIFTKSKLVGGINLKLTFTEPVKLLQKVDDKYVQLVNPNDIIQLYERNNTNTGYDIINTNKGILNIFNGGVAKNGKAFYKDVWKVSFDPVGSRDGVVKPSAKDIYNKVNPSRLTLDNLYIEDIEGNRSGIVSRLTNQNVAGEKRKYVIFYQDGVTCTINNINGVVRGSNRFTRSRLLLGSKPGLGNRYTGVRITFKSEMVLKRKDNDEFLKNPTQEQWTEITNDIKNSFKVFLGQSVQKETIKGGNGVYENGVSIGGLPDLNANVIVKFYHHPGGNQDVEINHLNYNPSEGIFIKTIEILFDQTAPVTRQVGAVVLTLQTYVAVSYIPSLTRNDGYKLQSHSGNNLTFETDEWKNPMANGLTIGEIRERVEAMPNITGAMLYKAGVANILTDKDTDDMNDSNKLLENRLYNVDLPGNTRIKLQ